MVNPPALLSSPRVQMETDADLDVGEFDIATRMVQPDKGRGDIDLPEEQLEPGATMVYKPKTPVATEAVSAADLGMEQEVVTLSFDGTRHEVNKRSVVLGRSHDCDIQLADANVSRRHAELRPDGDGWAISDLGSTNGVLVNGHLINRPTPLRPGDRIELGTTEVVFEVR